MPLTLRQRGLVYFCLFCLLATATIHLTFAITFLLYGKSRVEQTGRQQSYTYQLPTASYTFLTAISLLIYCPTAVANLLCQKLSYFLATFSWTLCWASAAMSFGVGVLTGNQYSLLNKYLQFYDIDSSILTGAFLIQYRCLLADAVISFGLGLPAAMVLMGFENRKRAFAKEQSMTKEIVIEKKDYRIQEHLTEDVTIRTSESSSQPS